MPQLALICMIQWSDICISITTVVNVLAETLPIMVILYTPGVLMEYAVIGILVSLW